MNIPSWILKEERKHAKTILKRNQINLVERLSNALHFRVHQRDGRLCDVWLELDKANNVVWKCNSVERNDEFKCVFVPPQEQAFCAHTMCCELWLKGWGLK